MTDANVLKIISWDQNSMKAVITINNGDQIEVMVPWENDSADKVKTYLQKLAADYLEAQALAAEQAQNVPSMPVLDLSDIVNQDIPIATPPPKPVIDVL